MLSWNNSVRFALSFSSRLLVGMFLLYALPVHAVDDEDGVVPAPAPAPVPDEGRMGPIRIWESKELCVPQKKIANIVEMLSSNLNSFGLSCYKISSEDWNILVTGLIRCSSLELLSLEENEYPYQDSIGALLESMEGMLTHLYLSNNDLRDVGTTQISTGIARHPLIELKLNNVNMGPDGMQCLVTNLPRTLGALWLKRNKIGNDGVKYLADGIERVPNLSVISLIDTGLDDGVLPSLEKILLSLQLSQLWTSENSLSVEARVRLTESMSWDNPSQLWDWRITDEVSYRALKRAIGKKMIEWGMKKREREEEVRMNSQRVNPRSAGGENPATARADLYDYGAGAGPAD